MLMKMSPEKEKKLEILPNRKKKIPNRKKKNHPPHPALFWSAISVSLGLYEEKLISQSLM